MRRVAALLAALCACLAVATAASAAEWRSEQPYAPGIDTHAELGEVGDIECWQANRCVLITAGNSGIPAGLFAYDGTGWYRYSTVCGGHEGRIAWAGPTEFWTISDQQAGQETGKAPPRHISLCHFKDGEVVASYAKPVGVAGSYLPMDAAACSGPSDCWFAGERLPGTVNEGAFHLRWDGGSLAAVPSLTAVEPQVSDPGRSVTGLAFYEGQLFEGVRVQADDVAPGASPAGPSFLHRIYPGRPNPFEAAEVQGSMAYGGEGAGPEQLEGFRFACARQGLDCGGALWAVSGAAEQPAWTTVLRKAGSGPFAQLPLVDPEHLLTPEDEAIDVTGLAAEPGGDYAWVGFRGFFEMEGEVPARIARVHADGTVDSQVTLPAAGEGLSPKGPAGPIACPAAGQCWMATERGWLFHRGPDLPRDTDSAMHALITYRPPDESLPFVPPVSLPEDNSGAVSPYERTEELVGESELSLPKGTRRRPALVSKVQQRLIHRRVLELRFFLRSRARVRLVAKRHRRVVAKTKRRTMEKGRRRLRLRLDPKRWPTKLDLQAHAVKGKRKR